MLIVSGALFLLFSACAMLYQADTRRGALSVVRNNSGVRKGLRLGAWLVFAFTLVMIAGLQGWERGIPVWLAMFTAVFILGLFLSAEKPKWHGPACGVSLAAGLLFTLGGVIA